MCCVVHLTSQTTAVPHRKSNFEDKVLLIYVAWVGRGVVAYVSRAWSMWVVGRGLCEPWPM